MNDFFALLSRMRYIARWGLMRSSIPENVQEHSHSVAVIAHALGVINNEIYGGTLNAERLATIALYHDATEILTGDLPTPVKYYSDEIRDAYAKVEHIATDKLSDMLPEQLKTAYRPILTQDKACPESVYIKAADRLSAYIKCIEERKAGNLEFLSAERQTRERIDSMKLPEATYFIEHFIPAFEKNLDELGLID